MGYRSRFILPSHTHPHTHTQVNQQPLTPEHQRPPSDSSSSSDSFISPPLSPTELLHKFPATHIGSSVAGKLHSVNEVIQRVLTENKPSQAKKVDLWLSLAQVRLVDTANETELVYATHETSRIRAIGVFSTDKRFIGYIIKEEGKPLTGHVLRCNSAGLMVQLVSFLRQSCQITFYQRGGSFYDELSTDDSEECDSPEVGHQLLSIVDTGYSLDLNVGQLSAGQTFVNAIL